MNRDDKLIFEAYLRENTLEDKGHLALDIAGLIPIVGEFADLANAAWYLKDKNYLFAGLSLLSAIPAFGQVITGSKFLAKIIASGGKASKVAGGVQKTGKALTNNSAEIKKIADTVGKFANGHKEEVDSIINSAAEKNKTIARHSSEIKRALGLDVSEKTQEIVKNKASVPASSGIKPSSGTPSAIPYGPGSIPKNKLF